MGSRRPAIAKQLIAALMLASLLPLLGCGPRVPKTYPVSGKVELTAGNLDHLAGSTVEAANSSDPDVRASGVLRADGTFKLESRHAGVLLNGAQEGKYDVRIILVDDDEKLRRRAALAIAPRFLDFKTSGLSFDVPTGGPITLNLAAR